MDRFPNGPSGGQILHNKKSVTFYINKHMRDLEQQSDSYFFQS